MNLYGRPRLYHPDRRSSGAERQAKYMAKLRQGPNRWRAHFMQDKTTHETPDDFFALYNERFHFTIDLAASPVNTKCPRYYTVTDDAFTQDWSHEIAWLNPPYSHKTMHLWLRKAWESSQAGATIVCLLPARTNNAWWHTWAIRGDLEFVQGKLRFKGMQHDAPFPSVVVIYRPPGAP
jgi:phage N-6-adenine-methyltransferase